MTTEILAELPHLKAEDRNQVYECLCELQENDLLHAAGPTATEKVILDQALSELQNNRNPSTPWRETLRRISAANPARQA